MDLQEPSWQVHRGQAIWQSGPAAPEIAGELIVATHPDGRAFVQFTKEPFPIVIARRDERSWELTVPQRRPWRGRGQPPARALWLQLPVALGSHPPPPWELSHPDAGGFVLLNPRTGERLNGFLSP